MDKLSAVRLLHDWTRTRSEAHRGVLALKAVAEAYDPTCVSELDTILQRLEAHTGPVFVELTGSAVAPFLAACFSGDPSSAPPLPGLDESIPLRVEHGPPGITLTGLYSEDGEAISSAEWSRISSRTPPLADGTCIRFTSETIPPDVVLRTTSAGGHSRHSRIAAVATMEEAERRLRDDTVPTVIALATNAACAHEDLAGDSLLGVVNLFAETTPSATPSALTQIMALAHDSKRLRPGLVQHLEQAIEIAARIVSHMEASALGDQVEQEVVAAAAAEKNAWEKMGTDAQQLTKLEAAVSAAKENFQLKGELFYAKNLGRIVSSTKFTPSRLPFGRKRAEGAARACAIQVHDTVAYALRQAAHVDPTAPGLQAATIETMERLCAEIGTLGYNVPPADRQQLRPASVVLEMEPKKEWINSAIDAARTAKAGSIVRGGALGAAAGGISTSLLPTQVNALGVGAVVVAPTALPFVLPVVAGSLLGMAVANRAAVFFDARTYAERLAADPPGALQSLISELVEQEWEMQADATCGTLVKQLRREHEEAMQSWMGSVQNWTTAVHRRENFERAKARLGLCLGNLRAIVAHPPS